MFQALATFNPNEFLKKRVIEKKVVLRWYITIHN